MSKEIQQIIEKAAALAPGERAILATVVDVEGSGYRRPGARMLIDREGYGVGTVSGGCLEADVLERAKKTLATGVPAVVTYDTTKDESSVFGLGMGCRGVVRVLLEPVAGDRAIIAALERTRARRTRLLIATIIAASDAEKIGGRLFYDAGEGFDRAAFPADFEFAARVAEDAARLYDAGGGYEVARYESETGRAEVFFEVVEPPLNLLLFGAGHDALPLVRFAKELGWRVTVVDHRPAFANAERLAAADEIVLARPEETPARLFADANSAAVVMTHSYERDRELVPRLLRSEFRYVGALGPKKRTEKILAEAGAEFSDAELARLRAPVGLDIGADTPESIALAIVAEIQAALKNRAGGPLRERRGPIYERR